MKITIMGGAGTVGSCTAFALASQGLADEMVMTDINQNLLKNHVMDINAAVVGQRDIIIRTGSDEDIAGSDVVIISAGVHFWTGASRREVLDVNIPIIRDAAKKIARFCPDAVVITATNPVDPLNYAVYLNSELDRKKIIGYNLNDSIRFRMVIARALGISPTRVEGVATGEHARATVLLFSSIRVDGQIHPVDEDFKRRIRKEMPTLLRSLADLGAGRSAGWTCAIGLAITVRAIGENTRQMIPCSAVLAGEYGYEGLSMGVPAIMDREGIREIVEWDLPADERKELEDVASELKTSADIVREATGPNPR
ncbi:malate dehydrogenase [Chloroflexota bacterium]